MLRGDLPLQQRVCGTIFSSFKPTFMCEKEKIRFHILNLMIEHLTFQQVLKLLLHVAETIRD